MDRGVFLHQAEHFETGTDDGGSQRVGEQVRTAALAQHVDNLFLAGGEAAEGTAKRFAQCACIDIHTAIGVAKLAHAVAGSAYHTCRVRLVDHHHGIVFLSQVADFLHRGHVAVHREHTIGADQAETLCLSLLQAFLQFGHVGVGIAVTLGLAQAHAVDDRCVVEGIRDDGILFVENRTEKTTVGIEAGRIENGVFGVEIFRDGFLQLLVDVLGTADEAHRRHAEAALVHHVLGTFNQTAVVGQAEVVVGAEVQHFFPLHLDGGALGTLDNSFFLVKPGTLQFVKSVAQVFFHFSVHNINFKVSVIQNNALFSIKHSFSPYFLQNLAEKSNLSAIFFLSWQKILLFCSHKTIKSTTNEK